MPIGYDCDVVVVGAGPAGSMAAKHAADGGADVILLEKRAEIGAPLRCAEGVSKRRLLEADIEPDPRWISARICGTIMRSPSGNVLKVRECPEDSEVGYVLNRHLFDKFLAERAAVSGARILTRAGCTGVMTENGKVVGVKIRHMGSEKEIRARCVIAADGFESQTARWAGLDTDLALSDINTCIQYLMSGVDVEEGFCEFILGSCAPGGYAWIFPKGDGTANVGLGIQGTECVSEGDAKVYLDRFIEGESRLRKGKVLAIASGAVSTKPGIACSVGDGIMAAGDAARVINPLTGGGIRNALRTGRMAGETAAACALRGDTSKSALMKYDRMWRSEMGDELQRNWRMKERYVSLSDDTLDKLILAVRDYGFERLRGDELKAAAKMMCPELFGSKGSKGEDSPHQQH